ncbi:MAG: hypothetical protein ACRDKY_05770 [Solirubrobacteraceae bacterium]
MKTLARTVTSKLRPRRLLVIVLCAGILVGAFFVLTSGDDETPTAAVSTAIAPRSGEDGDAPATRTEATTGATRTKSKPKQARAPKQPAASPTVRFASDRAVRNYALAQAIGSIKRPARVSMQVGAAPKQPVSINWNVVCLFASGAKTTSNTLTLTPPAIVPLTLPAGKAETCTISGQAQLTLAGVGRVKVFLLAQRRPAS